MEKPDVVSIGIRFRKQGNCDWILRSCMYNPWCMIVCRDDDDRDRMYGLYVSMLKKNKLARLLRWAGVVRVEPVFVTLDSDKVDSEFAIPAVVSTSAYV